MNVMLRPATDADRPFLEALYAESRADELSFTNLDSAAKQALCAQQFDAQDRSYREQFPDAAYDIVIVDGEASGRLIVQRGEVWHVVDILLAASRRGVGIGTTLLSALIDEADRAGRVITLMVAPNNPARHLYERLGFTEATGQDAIRVTYRRTPQAKTAS